MTACSLDKQWFGHPCDTAIGVLIAPATSRITLYLNFGSASTNKLDAGGRSNTLDVVQTECLDGCSVVSGRASISQDSTFKLVATGASIDLVILSSRIPVSRWTQMFGTLIQEIRRVLKPGGELLIFYEPDREDRLAGKNPMCRLRRHMRMFFDALFPTDRRRIASTLKCNGLTHSEWFVPWRDEGGCLTTIQPIGIRLLPARDWKQQLKMMAAKDAVVRVSASSLQRSLLKICALETSVDIVSESRSPKSVLISVLLVTPKEKVIAMTNVDGVDIVIRIPLSARALVACQQNMRALQNLQADPNRAGLAPHPLSEARLHGQYFSAESRIEGTPFVQLPLAERRLELVEQLIKTLNPTGRLTQRRLESTAYDELVGAPLVATLQHVAHGEDRATLEQYFAAATAGMPYAAGVSHGDFSLSNIFTQAHRISGVIDWDDGAMNGLPALDAISHICSRESHRSGCFSDIFCRLATRQWAEPLELAFLDRCYAHFNVEPEQHFTLVVLYWLQVVGNQSQFWFAHDSDFPRTHIDDVVRLISNRARSDTNFGSDKPMSVARTPDR